MPNVPTQDCLIWSGARDQKGYGMTRYNGRTQRAHRVAWEKRHGPIPKGQIICHTCDNPSCYNVDHLFIGTHQLNMDDKVAKGRQAFNNGANNGMAKLTPENVREIHKLLKTETLAEIGRKFNVSSSLIHKIKTGEVWRPIWEEFNG